MTTPLALDGIDMTDPGLFDDGPPFALFDEMRRTAPIFWAPAPSDWPDGIDRGHWHITRAADLRTISLDWEGFSSYAHGILMDERDGGGLDLMRQLLLSMDEPKHTVLRTLMNPQFSPRKVPTFEPAVRETVTRHLDAALAKGSFDFVEDFAANVPLEVICDIVGVPREDHKKLYEWAQVVVGFNDPEMIARYGRPEEVRQQQHEYAEQLLEERLKCPAHDVATLLAQGYDDEKVAWNERAGMVRGLIEAGADTTMNTLTLGMQAFSENPDQWERLLNDRSLVSSAVEEMLRWASVVMYLRRTATRDLELHGQTIRAGDGVVLWYIAGNYDPEAFEDPMRFDIGRRPNQHFAFGAGGRHFCLGNALARLELRVLLEELLERAPTLRVTGPAKTVRGNVLRGLVSLPVTTQPA